MDKENLHTELWQQFEQDIMKDTDRIAFLERLIEDEDAISRLTSLELVHMPAYLEEEMLSVVLGGEQMENANSENMVQIETQQSVYRPPKWLLLFSYSVKITFAAACAIIALFRMPDLGVISSEQMAQERMLKIQVREEEAAKRQQKSWNEQEKRRQKDSPDSSYITDALQFISEKIFVEE